MQEEYSLAILLKIIQIDEGTIFTMGCEQKVFCFYCHDLQIQGITRVGVVYIAQLGKREKDLINEITVR